MSRDALNDIHAALCRPGVTRLNHYVKVKNLPYSLAEVREALTRCRICAETKPQVLKPANPPLLRLLSRLNI